MTTKPTNPHFQRRVREALLNCTDLRIQTLRPLFVDQRLYPWRNGLPQMDNAQAQAQALISYLHNQHRADTGENALKLFLQTLSDQFDPMDNCYQHLKALADELNVSAETKIKALADFDTFVKTQMKALADELDTSVETQITKINPQPLTSQNSQLDPSQKRQLIELLLTSVTMNNRNGRDAVVGDLPSEINGNIKRHDADKIDVRNIVDTCLKYPDGLNQLIETIGFYEGQSTVVHTLNKFLK